MNKIKIIDLLNKIANGEEVPKKIRYKGKEYHKHKGNVTYFLLPNVNNTWEVDTYHLDSEVEIIEEEKELEKIISGEENDEYLIDKINELIDVVNKLKRDKEC